MIKIEKAGKIVIDKLRDKGFLAYFAGGFVRDFLLKIAPKDIDIATNAKPEDILKIFPKAKTIGMHFGVVMVRENKYSFEIATFRKDGIYSDGRKPEKVTWTDAKNDAMRRDFTINGMFYEPESKEIIDYVDGKGDLKNQLIKTVGEPSKRFQEDYLRMLRAIRFASRFEFKIEDKTFEEIKNYAHNIKKISVERIRDEFNKIILHKNRVYGLKLLIKSGLIEQFFPEFNTLDGCEQPPEFHPEGDVLQHTFIMLDGLDENPSLSLVLSVLLHDIGKPSTQVYDEKSKRFRFNHHEHVGANMSLKILKRLKYSNDTIDKVFDAVKMHMVFKDVQNMRKAKLRRFIYRENFDEEMELHRLDCSSSHKILDNYKFLSNKKIEFNNEPVMPKPFINGNDLIKLGLKPGPFFKNILTNAMDLQLENKFISKEEALNWLNEKINQDKGFCD